MKGTVTIANGYNQTKKMTIVGDIDEDICQFKHFPKGTPLSIRVLKLAPGISCDVVFSSHFDASLQFFFLFFYTTSIRNCVGSHNAFRQKAKQKINGLKSKTRLKTCLTKKASFLVMITSCIKS